MERIDLWFEQRIGVVRPVGALDLASVNQLRRVIFEAEFKSSIDAILIIEDEVTEVCPDALAVLRDAQAICRDLGGCLAVVSTDRRTGTPGRISAHALIEHTFRSRRMAIAAILHDRAAADTRRREHR